MPTRKLALPFVPQSNIDAWSIASELMQRSSVIVVIAYVLIHLPWTKHLSHNTTKSWLSITLTVLFFTIFAIYGTHTGLKVNHYGQALNWTEKFIFEELNRDVAIIGFRDAITLVAGLSGGVWVGLGTGILAGIDCYLLGGMTQNIGMIITIQLGLFSGLAKYFFPNSTKTLLGTLIIALLGSIYQLSELREVLNPYPLEKVEYLMIIFNCFTCGLFFLVFNDLERDKLLYEAKETELSLVKARAELLALHAQIEPHFFNNTLAGIQALIHTAPDKACDYIAKLAHFFNQTRETAGLTLITVEKEIQQLNQYMAFQELRFNEKIAFEIKVSEDILDYPIPPRSLQTLVENTLRHGKRGLTHPLSILISGTETEEEIILSVQDNGRGIEKARLALLTQQIVESEYGNGTALYHLRKNLTAIHTKTQLSICSELNQGTIVTLCFFKERTE